jgi:hypothetical protein
MESSLPLMRGGLGEGGKTQGRPCCLSFAIPTLPSPTQGEGYKQLIHDVKPLDPFSKKLILSFIAGQGLDLSLAGGAGVSIFGSSRPKRWASAKRAAEPLGILK